MFARSDEIQKTSILSLVTPEHRFVSLDIGQWSWLVVSDFSVLIWFVFLVYLLTLCNWLFPKISKANESKILYSIFLLSAIFLFHSISVLYFTQLHHQQSHTVWYLLKMYELHQFLSVLSKCFEQNIWSFFTFAFATCEKRKPQIADSRNNKKSQVTTKFPFFCILIFSCVLYLFMFHVKYCVYVEVDRYVSNLKQTTKILTLKRIIYWQDFFRGFGMFPMLTHLVRLCFF